MMEYYTVIKIKTVATWVNDFNTTLSKKQHAMLQEKNYIWGKIDTLEKYWKKYTTMITEIINRGDFFFFSILQTLLYKFIVKI